MLLTFLRGLSNLFQKEKVRNPKIKFVVRSVKLWTTRIIPRPVNVLRTEHLKTGPYFFTICNDIQKILRRKDKMVYAIMCGQENAVGPFVKSLQTIVNTYTPACPKTGVHRQNYKVKGNPVNVLKHHSSK